MKKGPESASVIALCRALVKASKKNKAPIWARVAELIEKPARRKFAVNLYGLQKNAAEGETIVVPTKILSLGKISKKLTVAALSVSKPAAARLAKAGCTVISIAKLLEQNPKGSKVRIIV